MDSDTVLEKRFERAKSILSYVSQPIAPLGLWPVNITAKSQIRLVMYILYHGPLLTLFIIDLVLVFGDLQEIVDNLTVTCFQFTLIFRLLSIRFQHAIRRVIREMDEFHENPNFSDCNEKEIYVSRIEKVERFHRSMLVMAWMCSIMWFSTPLFLHFSTRGDPNNTIPLADPLRLDGFVNMSNIHMAALTYIIEVPVLFVTSWYLATYSLQFAFINCICGRLACLAYTIKNLRVDGSSDVSNFFRCIVERHIKITQFAVKVNDALSLILLIELFVVTFRVVIISFTIILHIDTAEFVIVTNYFIYLCLMLMCMYGNCYMGEQLHFESVNLVNAYSECNWYELPATYQKSFVLCIVQAQTPLKITAGKFYVYTLNGFTGILRSSMAYVSMLRQIM